MAENGRGVGAAIGDAGLARERTALAWTRTALALAATGGLALRAGVEFGSGAWYVIAGLLLCAAVAAGLHSTRAYRGRTPIMDRTHGLRLIAVTTGVTAVAAFVLALVP